MTPKAKTILVVDDAPDIADVVGLILQKIGYKVLSAMSIIDAEKLITQERPSLILLDVFLAGEDGRFLAQKLKKSAKTRNIPIILMSAHPPAYVEWQKHGADGFMSKPFTLDLLSKTLHKHLR